MLLARNLALRNPELSQRDLNFAVQRTIDRIIFLRICEDRGVERSAQLQALLNGPTVYPRLCELFEQADDRYNSGLFHFHKEKGRPEEPDNFTLSLKIDDKPLKQIISHLYYPDSPYEFSVLPADILGQVYEQFLGKVIRLTSGHQAKIEDKPEVKKAGGVYYTPTYIVDYIVQQTVGKLLEGKTPQDVGGLTKTWKPSKRKHPMTVLDPACGSGSFLIGAYQKLLDWHRDWYVNDGPKKHKERIYQVVPAGSDRIHAVRPDESGHYEQAAYRLTTAERKRILLSHIYGVDIDPQAVEVTKLSLLLKVLEGENQETLNRQLKMFHERALPDLAANIKCGNSLIGPDFYDGQQISLFDEDEALRINAFDWQVEFPHIFPKSSRTTDTANQNPGISKIPGFSTTGGFDAVIGNPPYGIPLADAELEYCIRYHPATQKCPDSYCLFMSKAMALLNDFGVASLIVPNTFCDLESCDDFRRSLITHFALNHLWESGWAFKDAVVDTLVYVISKQPPSADASVLVSIQDRNYSRKTGSFCENDLCKIDYRNSAEDKAILRKVLEQTTPLETVATVNAGVKLYEKGKGSPPQTAGTLRDRPFTVKDVCPDGWSKLYRGAHVHRYSFDDPKECVHYGQWLAAPRSSTLFESPKILMRRTDDRLMACIDSEDAICVNSCHVIKLRNSNESLLRYKYILGLLNSRLLQFIFELQNPQMVGKVFAEIKVIYVQRLPIVLLQLCDETENLHHLRMVELVEQMLSLNERVAGAKTDHQKTINQRQIDATDRQIDQLVYELYGLTDAEIRIVEEATAS